MAGRVVQVRWVPAHCKEADVVAGKISREDWERNARADARTGDAQELWGHWGQADAAADRADLIVEGILSIGAAVYAELQKDVKQRTGFEPKARRPAQAGRGPGRPPKADGPPERGPWGPHDLESQVEEGGRKWRCTHCRKTAGTLASLKTLRHRPCGQGALSELDKSDRRQYGRWRAAAARWEAKETAAGRAPVPRWHDPVRAQLAGGLFRECRLCDYGAPTLGVLGFACPGRPPDPS